MNVLKTNTIRSFVKRDQKKTPTVKNALLNDWPRFGLPSILDGLLDMTTVFGRPAARLVIELGFGDGQNLSQMAAGDRETNFLGLEVYTNGVGQLLKKINQLQLNNVRIFQGDAWPFLNEHIPDHEIDELKLLFPDPWPKVRHHKRRLVKDDFIEMLKKKLKPGGQFHMATDWVAYAETVQALFAQHPEFELYPLEFRSEISQQRRITKFETKGIKKGHEITDLVYRLSKPSQQSPETKLQSLI